MPQVGHQALAEDHAMSSHDEIRRVYVSEGCQRPWVGHVDNNEGHVLQLSQDLNSETVLHSQPHMTKVLKVLTMRISC